MTHTFMSPVVLTGGLDTSTLDVVTSRNSSPPIWIIVGIERNSRIQALRTARQSVKTADLLIKSLKSGVDQGPRV